MIRKVSTMFFLAVSLTAYAQQAPQLEFVCELRVKVDKPIVVGEVATGTRRVIPIVGGTVNGPNMKGEIMNVGADWQVVRNDGVSELEALYQFKTDDGAVIFVRNIAKRVATPEVSARLARGEYVEPSQYYFRGTPTFEAPPGKYAWMNNSIFICTGDRLPEAVIIRVYRVL